MNDRDRDRLRMSTAQLQVVRDDKYRNRRFDLVAALVVVVLYAGLKWAEKALELDLSVIMVAMAALVTKYLSKPADAVTEAAVQSLPTPRLENALRSIPPKRLAEIYQRVQIATPPAPTLRDLLDQSRGGGEETPAKPQPHHRPRTPR